jgi:hypothetical protein
VQGFLVRVYMFLIFIRRNRLIFGHHYYNYNWTIDQKFHREICQIAQLVAPYFDTIIKGILYQSRAISCQNRPTFHGLAEDDHVGLKSCEKVDRGESSFLPIPEYFQSGTWRIYCANRSPTTDMTAIAVP